MPEGPAGETTLEERALKIALVGCGAVTQAVYVPLLSRRRDVFEVTAVCDLSQTLADTVGTTMSVENEAVESRGRAVKRGGGGKRPPHKRPGYSPTGGVGGGKQYAPPPGHNNEAPGHDYRYPEPKPQK